MGMWVQVLTGLGIDRPWDTQREAGTEVARAHLEWIHMCKLSYVVSQIVSQIEIDAAPKIN
jgi:hypothetical protein